MALLPQKNNMDKKISLAAAAFFIGLTCALAQPATELSSYKSKYPGEPLVTISSERSISIKLDKGDLLIESQDYEERMLLDNKGNMYTKDQVEYSGFTPLLDISAKTLVPEDKKYRTIEVDKFSTNDVMDGSIFHDDTKEKTFYYPGLTEGAKTVLSYSKQINEPHFLPGFFFGSFMPIENAKYSITCPKDVDLAFLYINMKEDDVIFTKTESKGNILYAFEWKNIPKIEYEGDAPDLKYFIPHIITYIKDYTVNGSQKVLAGDVNELHNWYYTFIKDLDSSKDPELISIVDSLTKGISNTEDKVRKIYYWVQSNIKYVAFEEGMGGYIPRQASAVCARRYGDCKDMANTIAEMLNIAGIEAHLTWIGTRDIPYTYESVPTPAVDNHMIVAYKTGDTYEFLDGTETHLPFGYPSSFIQGKEALVNISEGKFDIIKVPEVPAEKNKLTENVVFNINGNKITATATNSYTGYYRERTYGSLTRIKESDWKKDLANAYGMGNNTCQLDTIYAENLNDRDKDLLVHYAFNLRDYTSTAGDEIYVNMILDKFYQYDKISKERELPIEKDFKSSLNENIVLNIPAGYTVTYLPPDASFSDPLFGFSVHYSSDAEHVKMEYNFTSNHLLLEKDHFAAWNKMQEALTKAYSEVVILQKK